MGLGGGVLQQWKILELKISTLGTQSFNTGSSMCRKCRGWRDANRRQHKPLALSVYKDIQTIAQTEQKNTSDVFNPQK